MCFEKVLAISVAKAQWPPFCINVGIEVGTAYFRVVYIPASAKELDVMKAVDLRQRCKEQGLKQSGTKACEQNPKLKTDVMGLWQTDECFMDTPRKINMEPENTPLEEENHHFQVLC